MMELVVALAGGGVAIVVVCCCRRMYYCTVICLIWFEIHFIVLNVNCQKAIKNNNKCIIHKINHNRDHNHNPNK